VGLTRSLYCIRCSGPCIKLIVKCIFVVYIILGDKHEFGQVYFFWRKVTCVRVNVVSCGPNESILSDSTIVGFNENLWVFSSFAIMNNSVCVSVVPAQYGVKPFVQYLQKEDYCGQNNAKTKHQEWWEDVLQANTGKSSNISTAFRLL